MTAAAVGHRPPRRVAVAVGTLATLAGRAVRVGLTTGPGVLGAAGITYGAGQVYAPLWWIVGGAFLLLVDRAQATPEPVPAPPRPDAP